MKQKPIPHSKYIFSFITSSLIFLVAILLSPLYGVGFSSSYSIDYSIITFIFFLYILSLGAVTFLDSTSSDRPFAQNILLWTCLSLGLILLFIIFSNKLSITISPVFSIAIPLFQYIYLRVQNYALRKTIELTNISNQILIYLLTGMILLFVYSATLFVHNGAHSWSDLSRMAAIQSIVENRTQVIDDSVFNFTGDKVLINGHFYSDKLYISILPGVIVYSILHKFGIVLGYKANLGYYLVTLFTIKLFWYFGLVAFYKIFKKINLKEIHRWVLIFILGFSSTYLSYSTVYNNHILSASYLTIAFYFYLKVKENNKIIQNLALSGLFFSISAANDMPTSVFYVGFALLIFLNKDLRFKIVYFFLPAIITILPTLVINYQISGSILPFTMNLEYFNYPGSPWVESMDSLSGMSVNDLEFFAKYAISLLFGLKGFITFHPYLIIAIPLMISEVLKKRRFNAEATIISIASFIMMLYYFLFTNNYSGVSFCVRWFVPLLPYFVFFLYPYFENLNRGKRLFLYVLVVFAFAITILGSFYIWGNIGLA